jgi:uncharacterized protein YjbI with pentapeptide repeats
MSNATCNGNRIAAAPETVADLDRSDVIANLNRAKPRLRGVRFDGLDLSDLDFSGVDLVHASFKGCKLNGTNFSRCKLGFADFTASAAEAADFTDAKASSAIFAGVDFTDCIFHNASIDGADFTESRLTRCEFADAVAFAMLFTGATLKGCCFDGAQMDKNSWDGAVTDDCTFSGITAGDGKPGQLPPEELKALRALEAIDAAEALAAAAADEEPDTFTISINGDTPWTVQRLWDVNGFVHVEHAKRTIYLTDEVEADGISEMLEMVVKASIPTIDLKIDGAARREERRRSKA